MQLVLTCLHLSEQAWSNAKVTQACVLYVRAEKFILHIKTGSDGTNNWPYISLYDENGVTCMDNQLTDHKGLDPNRCWSFFIHSLYLSGDFA